MKLIIVMLVSLLLASCSRNTTDVVRVLEAEGCTETNDHGADYIFNGCSEKDFFNNQFTCIKNSKVVSGVVCSGFFKGMTIRYY